MRHWPPPFRGLRGYRINIAGIQAIWPRAYDGSAEIWFDDRAAMEAGLSSQAGRIAGEDTAAFAAQHHVSGDRRNTSSRPVAAVTARMFPVADRHRDRIS
eukprot:jgi/Tetstr1/433405/TSEL_022679.t1